jgi:hypothetical protein
MVVLLRRSQATYLPISHCRRRYNLTMVVATPILVVPVLGTPLNELTTVTMSNEPTHPCDAQQDLTPDDSRWTYDEGDRKKWGVRRSVSGRATSDRRHFRGGKEGAASAMTVQQDTHLRELGTRPRHSPKIKHEAKHEACLPRRCFFPLLAMSSGTYIYDDSDSDKEASGPAAPLLIASSKLSYNRGPVGI